MPNSISLSNTYCDTTSTRHRSKVHLPHLYSAQEASHILHPDELAFLSKWSNPPGGCARAMSWMVSELQLKPEQQV